MDRTIKHITKRLVGQLPEDAETYKLSDLHKSGFPGFVIKRIQVELQRNLAESIILPETEWAEMESDTVQHAWDQFVSAIRAQARLPRSYAYAVVETAISDIMNILVQPRKNLPDVIFGASEVLEYEKVTTRVEAVVVYRHFASLIPRYMEKKGYSELSRGMCSKVIKQADEKLTSRYTPLNWAQMLEPLFLLLEEQIDTNLLRLFFEDKNLPGIARRFDMLNSSVNRHEFIEVLSSPNIPDEEGQNELFRQGASKPEATSGWVGLVKTLEEDDFDEEKEKVKPEEAEESHKENEEDSDSLNTLYNEEEETDTPVLTGSKEEDRKNELNDFFSEDVSEHEVEKETSLAEDSEPEFEGGEEQEVKKDPGKDEKDIDTGKKEQDEGKEQGIELEASESDEPIWQRFLSAEEEAKLEQWREEEEEATPDNNGFEEEPLIDLTKEESEEENYEELKKLLSDERERFVEDIFSGGEEAYEEALQEIAAKDNWRSASQYIERAVFKRNLVDMYSETAVDFTDRLQTYFIEMKKSN